MFRNICFVMFLLCGELCHIASFSNRVLIYSVNVLQLEFERQNLLDIESRQFSLPSKLQQRYHEFVMHDEDQSARKNKKITIPLSEAVGYRNIYSSMKSKTFITDDEEFPTTDEFDITTVDDNMKNNRLADQSQDHNIRILSLTSQNLEIIQKFQADLKNRQGVNPNLLAEKYISRNGHINMRKRDYNESNYVYHLKILQDRNEREKIKWENDKILSSEWFLKLLTILKQYKKKRINKKKIPPNIYKFLGSVKEAILMKVELTRQNIWHLMDNVFDEEDFMNNIVYMCIQHVCDTKNISCEAIRSHLKKRGIQPAPKLLMNVKRARKIKSMKKKISTEKKSVRYLSKIPA